MFTFKTAPLRAMTLNENYRQLGLTEFSTVDPVAEIPSFPRRWEQDFSVNLTYDETSLGPVTIRQVVQRSMTQLPAVEYLLEVTLSGEVSASIGRRARLRSSIPLSALSEPS
jgi:hypothetical protein